MQLLNMPIHRTPHICSRTARVVAAALLAAALALLLTACSRPSRPHASNADYVGIWICIDYHDDKGTTAVELGKGYNQYIFIHKDGTAQLATTDQLSAIVRDCEWYRTQEDDVLKTDYGIMLDDHGLLFPFTYFRSSDEYMEPRLTEERLTEGDLAADYGYRTDYFQKVSNDPDDPDWIPDWLSDATPASELNFESPDVPEGAITWDKASSHIGEYVTVLGPAVASEYMSSSNEQPTYIDIGEAYPDDDRVSLVVWGEDRDSFPDDPEDMYLHRTICASGELYEYDGAPYMKISSPDQIEVLD